MLSGFSSRRDLGEPEPEPPVPAAEARAVRVSMDTLALFAVVAVAAQPVQREVEGSVLGTLEGLTSTDL